MFKTQYLANLLIFMIQQVLIGYLFLVVAIPRAPVNVLQLEKQGTRGLSKGGHLLLKLLIPCCQLSLVNKTKSSMSKHRTEMLLYKLCMYLFHI